MVGCHALAFIEPTCELRLRAALTPPGELNVRRSPHEFIESVRRGWPNVAVLDPVLVRGLGTIPAALNDAQLPTLCYIYLTAEYAEAAVALLQYLPAQVIAYGYSDDRAAVVSAVQASERVARGRTLLDALHSLLTRLPDHVVRGLHAMNADAAPVVSVQRLAAHAGIHRGTMARLFADARLAPVSQLILALRIAQHFDAITDAGVEPGRAAQAVGIRSARTLNDYLVRVSGCRVADFRSGASFEQYGHGVARQLDKSRGDESRRTPVSASVLDDSASLA